MNRNVLLCSGLGLIAIVTLGYALATVRQEPNESPEAAAPVPGVLTAEQIRQLGIRVEAAREAGAVPVGSVPGLVSLPPDARVAVTAPFSGVAVKVLVIEGEQVERGQALAVVRAAEPVQFGADLARAQADLELQRAQANRLESLARQGVVAGARADEARAALRRTEVTVAENRRLLALGGADRDGTATLRSTIAGRVAKVSVETGGPVGGAMAPFVIENSSALSLDLQLPGRLAATVRPGMPVAVTPSRSTRPLMGRILSVSGSLDPETRSVPAKASLPAGPGLVPGQAVTVVISDPQDQRRSGVSVPSTAVTRIDGHDFVFQQQVTSGGTRFLRRKVTLLADTGDTAVLSGELKPGDVVAVSGVAELKSIFGGE